MPLRRNWLFMSLALAMAATAALSGCGSNAPPELPRSIVITAPVPLKTLVAGCDVSELEAWYEVATSLSDRFAAESLDALNRVPETVPDTISRQRDLLDRILAEPVPECAGTTHDAIIRRLQGMHGAYLAFDEGRIDAETLRTRVGEEHAALQTEVATMLSDLGAGLEALFRQEARAG